MLLSVHRINRVLIINDFFTFVGKLALKPILMKDESDSLWITELEEIFGFPRHYTDVKNLSATKRQGLIGKSWSVQTLTAIFRFLCPFFECNTIETN